MIKLHHLEDSRSHRILWLLEELGLDYELIVYPRDPKTRFGPPALKALHPLGKSPLLEMNGRMLAESGAIVESVLRHHGQGRLTPAPESADYDSYLYWLHYAEGSAMLPFLLHLYAGRIGEASAPIRPRIDSEIQNHLSHFSAAIAGREFLVGNTFSGADIQMSFVLEMARPTGTLDAFPHLIAFHDRLQARPAYQRAVERGGPITLKMMARR